MHANLTRRTFLQRSTVLGAALAGGPLLRAARAQEVLKVGVVYVSPKADIGWTKQHSLGAQAIRDAFPGQVEVTELENISQPQDAERVFRDLASGGHKLVFGTSFSHSTPIQKVAPQFPDTAFEHCSGLKSLPNLGTFEAKYFEGTYVAGVAAGKMTKSHKLGFIAGYPIPDVVAAINAMTLGARSVDPEATMSVIFLNSWYDPAKEKEAANTLISQGCDVVTSMTDTGATLLTDEEKGVWGVGYASDLRPLAPTRQLTSFMLDWSDIYVGAARDVMAGTWTSKERWQGLREGTVKMAPFNEAIPADTIALLEKTEDAIKSGQLHPFAGELKDQAGTVRVPQGSVMANPDIRSFNWFVSGVIGQIG